MKDFEVVFEQVEMSPEETQMRLNKAFEILFSEIIKKIDPKDFGQNYQFLSKGGENFG